MYCRKPGEGDTAWMEAVFHDTIREELINAAEGPNRDHYSRLTKEKTHVITLLTSLLQLMKLLRGRTVPWT